MRPTRIVGADERPLAAPVDWNPENGPCTALFVRREVHDGVHYMRSAWEAEPGEAIFLYAGARLNLGIAGNCHPVVQLEIGDLPPDFTPVVHARRFVQLNGRESVHVEMLFPHGGSRRAYIDVDISGSMAAAVAFGIEQIEALARKLGWVE